MNIFKDMEANGKESTQPKKPCRACYDFKSWTKMQQNELGNKSTPSSNENQNPHPSAGCPLDKDELGRNTWGFLHTMAAYFPDTPTAREQKQMTYFMKLFSKYYPCDHCAEDFRRSIRESPPETTTRWGFSQWLCRMHNQVNKKLGKEEFDCNLVDQRWKDGWDDGSCG